MTKYCYIHTSTESFKECDSCGSNICHDCAESYWHTNAISSMFLPKKTEEQKLILCTKCLRKAKRKNAFMTSFLLIMIVGFIAVTIFIARTG
ncbi:MAG: hypothetical protein KGD64_12445 [Candidatus Heimdallarchaeota archaeon]|nr:hypothetical protein [Candidatus Heimdallarchaeota archaeon]